jgi:hypothetical protein
VQITYVEALGKEWSSDGTIQKDGFIFLDVFKRNIMSMQSIGTGDLFVNKIVEFGMWIFVP